ncbi:hypothetical protein D3C76_627040 [compost metagenome]
MTLGNLFAFMLLATVAAWWWRAHGIRERALMLVKQHCVRQGVELLDENVALRRLRLRRDQRGQLRLAREYGFEFTATGQERYAGSIVMLGQQPGRIELAPFRFEPQPQAQTPAQPHIDDVIVDAVFDEPRPAQRSAEVVHLDEWRRNHQQKKFGD